MSRRVAIIALAVLVVFFGAYFTRDIFFPSVAPIPAVKRTTEIYSTTSALTGGSITVTAGVPHSVPLSDIVSGGPPQDGIPSIDVPRFLSISDAEAFLRDEDLGISFVRNTTARFYPLQVLVWHEIVNDMVENERVLVTYSPLSRSALVFDPVVDGERVLFGTSGRLWNSNLVMYDRKTNSLWSQILGRAILGSQTGATLQPLHADVVSFGAWKRRHTSGVVLSRRTGSVRFYGNDPYGDYYTTPGIYFPVSYHDDRLPDKTDVFGLVVDGRAKVYARSAVEARTHIEDVVNGVPVTLVHDVEFGSVRAFKTFDSRTVDVPIVPAFWFAWVAAYPDTEIYQ